MSDSDEKRSRLRALVQDHVRRLFGKEPTQPPGDPHAHTMAPLRRGPKGRSGAAAVDEPEEDSYRAFPPRHQ
jgi:hypothetical protein